jgi:predicted DNA-binding protein (UPF0251 family)
MPRKPKHRKISFEFKNTIFKPAWIPTKNLEVVTLEADELEAIRLAYLENLSMQQGAEKMWVSAPTFHRILKKASKKIWEALIFTKAIKIEK